MPYLIGFAILAGVFFVAVYVSFAFLAPIAAVLAGALAVGIVLVEYVSASIARFWGAQPIDGIRVAPPARPDASDGRDPGYRSYFFGPVLLDYAQAVQAAGVSSWDRLFGRNVVPDPGAPRWSEERGSALQQVLEGWRSKTGTMSRVVSSGPMVGSLVGLAGGAASASALAVAFSVVFGLVLLLVVVSATGLGLALRSFELVSLKLRGITVECPSCHQRVTRSAYVCPHCPAQAPSIHRRLVPGSLGIFRRVCRCGNTLPTLLAGGKWKLQAYCPRDGCETLLPVKGLTAPTFHVPVVAGTGAGKTIFMMSVMASLESRSRAQGSEYTFEFADENAKRTYVEARKALEAVSFGAIRPTVPGLAVRAFNVYVASPSARTRLLYMYDPAGERFEYSERLASFRFLGLTQGVVFIVDPFALPPVRQLLDPTVLTEVQASAVAPEGLFTRFAQNLRESLDSPPDRKLRMPIAVVVTKADALARLSGVAHPLDSEAAEGEVQDPRTARSSAVRAWLGGVGGQRSLLSLVDNTFTTSSYFVVSALDAFSVQVRRTERSTAGVTHDEPSAPVRWLLETASRR